MNGTGEVPLSAPGEVDDVNTNDTIAIINSMVVVGNQNLCYRTKKLALKTNTYMGKRKTASSDKCPPSSR